MRAAKEEPQGENRRDDQDDEAQKHLLHLFLGTAQQYGGKWQDIFRGVSDKREAGKIQYSMSVLLFTGVLLFICQLGARRQVNHKLRGNARVRAKYRALFEVEDIPHGDTLNYTYQQLQVEEVQEVVCRLMEGLMEREELQKRRLFGIYDRIALDGTGV